jgi:hypothetical protein
MKPLLAWSPRSIPASLESQLRGKPGPEVRQHDVGAREEPVDDGPGRRVAQVERQRVLAAVAGDEVARLARRQRAQLAHRIALQRLDLDDVSAALGEHLGAEGRRDELPELHHLDAGERSGVVETCHDEVD